MPSIRRQTMRLALFIGLLCILWLVFNHLVLRQDNGFLWIEAGFILLLAGSICHGAGVMQKSASQLHSKLLTQALKNRILFDEAPVAMVELQHGIIVLHNQAARLLLGEHAEGQPLLSHFDSAHRARASEWLSAPAQASNSTPLTLRHGQATVELSMMPQEQDSQNSRLVVLYDITERKRMMQQLQQRESLLASMGRIARVGGWELELANNKMHWSEETYHIYELPVGHELTLEQAMSYYPPAARRQLQQALDTCIACGQPWDLELPFTSHSGATRWVRAQGDAIREPDGRIQRLHGAFQDISERKLIKQALQQEKTRLNAILDNAVDGIVVFNAQGIIEQFNPAACHIFGYSSSDALGRHVRDLMPARYEQEHPDLLHELLRNGQTALIGKGTELTGRRSNGQPFPAEISLSSWQEEEQRYFSAVVRDITERRVVQAQLIQSQKMESLSMLSGGLAHDFNNLLGIITGNLDFLEPRLAGDEKALQRLQSAIRATERGADITRRMLALSRQRSSNHPISPQQVNRLISDMSKVLTRMLGPNYVLHTELAEDAYDCKLDPAEFENVLLNLSVNARDAMPDGGEISIRTHNIQPADMLGPHLAPLDPAQAYLEISFADTGCGMESEVLQRAFEPFFSTKQAKGTGLGLSMVYTFIKDLKGHLRVDSQPGAGSTFYLYLPRATLPAAPIPAPAPASPLPTARDNECILVVDDEPDLLHATSLHLQQLGYSTLEASDAASAWQLLAQHAQIKLLLSDVVMPGGMFGTELAQQAQQRYPHLAVLLCSGFPQKIRDNPAHAGFAELMISKPFRKSELACRVRQVLDNNRERLSAT